MRMATSRDERMLLIAMLEERARAAGLTLSEWVREVLLSAPVEPGACSPGCIRS